MGHFYHTFAKRLKLKYQIRLPNFQKRSWEFDLILGLISEGYEWFIKADLDIFSKKRFQYFFEADQFNLNMLLNLKWFWICLFVVLGLHWSLPLASTVTASGSAFPPVRHLTGKTQREPSNKPKPWPYWKKDISSRLHVHSMYRNLSSAKS